MSTPTTNSASGTGPDRPPHVLADRPVDIRFSFEQPQSRVGAIASMVAHLALALVAVIVIRYVPERAPIERPPNDPLNGIVWLAEPGPGGGGGGGGDRTPEPPRKAELPGREAITVPVQKKPDLAPPPPPPEVEEPPPLEAINIPAVNMAAAQQTLPGALQSQNVTAESTQGSGSGGGAGTGTGTGVGEGQGSGLGDGFGGGTGGGAYRPGAGITQPQLLREVKPQYTADAMRAKVQGSVWLECVVMPDGTVGNVRVIRSLDPVFGLDQEAIKAARLWRFRPGVNSKTNEPVPVLVTIELTFTLR